jgi:hypothetical protein
MRRGRKKNKGEIKTPKKFKAVSPAREAIVIIIPALTKPPQVALQAAKSGRLPQLAAIPLP